MYNRKIYPIVSGDNDTPESPEHNAVEISLENKVVAERFTASLLTLEPKVWSE